MCRMWLMRDGPADSSGLKIGENKSLKNRQWTIVRAPQSRDRFFCFEPEFNADSYQNQENIQLFRRARLGRNF